MVKEISGRVFYPDLEKNILKFWREKDIFEKSVASRDPEKSFIFYEGPPTANGKPGIHHVLSRTVKDLVCRLRTMQGFRVERKAGWDTHGLPVEIEVEKKLGIQGKDQVVEYGIEKFNQQCRESVFAYKKEWDELTRRIGYWIDLENPYITYTNEYIESVWWIIEQFWKKKLLYIGYKILPYCPRCETPLSSHELSLGYQDVEDPSIYVKMALKDEKNTHFLVWTTTPWTLLSNVALALHPDITYVKISHGDEFLILAEDRLGCLDGDYRIVETYKGSDLADTSYTPIYSFCTTDKKAYYTVLADFVSVEEGTGIVHIAPAFGEDDYVMGQKYDLPVFQPVDKSGRFTDEITQFKGLFVKDADPAILDDLKSRNILYKSEMIKHSYPFCWRCDSPLLYFARKSWYIRTTAIKDELIRDNKKIEWYPKEVGEGRFGEWLENNVDWALSRDRFWGTPLNIWTCESCEYQDCIGSIAELKKRSNLSNDIDLHRPFIDEVEVRCTKCGNKMMRTPEVIDCWFDSGAMPYGQFHYPFEHKEKFAEHFPAAFIAEGVDQTRGWFYSLLVLGTFLFGESSYKSCLSTEMILDKEGQKMSKSRGNAADPIEILDHEGADALRWYLLTVSPPWVPTRFDREGVREARRKFLDTLVNVYNFYAIYANIDNYEAGSSDIPAEERAEIDRWLLSKLNTMVTQVSDNLERYELTKAARMISFFVIEDLSNWYVRRCRRRFWKSEMGHDKLAAYQTLYEVLVTTARLIAPFVPFISEEIFLNLRSDAQGAPSSVHLAEFPNTETPPCAYSDELLEARMDLVRRIVLLGRSLRNEASLKVRQPLRAITLIAASQKRKSLLEGMEELIKEEINVKEIEFLDDLTSLQIRRAEPNFKSLGPKLGKHMAAASEIIKSFTREQIRRLEEKGDEFIFIEGHEVSITADDVTLRDENAEGTLIATEGDLTVALDSNLSEELILEGLAREFINRVQNTRKEAGLDVVDRIRIFCKVEGSLADAIETQSEYIRNETLATEINCTGGNGDFQKEWHIGDTSIIIGLSKVTS